MRISDWSSDVCSSDLPAEKDIGIIKKVGATKKNNIAMLTTLSQILPIIHSCESILRVAVPGQTTRGKAMGQRHQGKRRNQQQHAQRAGRTQVVENLYFLGRLDRSEEHTSELQSLMRISYAVFCLKKKNNTINNTTAVQQMITYYIHIS